MVLYRHPLNGEPLEEPWTGRATAYVINNIEDCLPQYGISKADFIFELETEGGITRLLAVFSDLQDAGTIGPVRSARTFFNSISKSFDAPIAHCGGSVRGIRGYHDLTGSKISDWAHLNAQTYEGTYFFRDYTRYNSGVAWEHCLFTDGEKSLALLNKLGYNTVNEEGTDYGYRFADDAAVDGEIAAQITVNFKWWKTTTLTYNAKTGLYEADQYGYNHIDGQSGETLAYKNVFVLYTNQTGKHDGTYTRSYYDLIGSGEGHYAIGGEIIPIKWSREDLDSPFVYTLEDGTLLTLGVGMSYVGIVDDSKVATYK